MIIAFNSNTGSEYDLEEDSFAKDHRIYHQMILNLTRQKKRASMQEVLIMPQNKRNLLKHQLMLETGATEREVSKLLRL
jgi:hypothetical protein